MGNRSIPPMNRLLEDAQIAPFEQLAGRETVKAAVNEVLEAARRSESGVPSFALLRDTIVLRLETSLESQRASGLLPVINATGILLHTNLGRAPLARTAFDAAAAVGCGYSNLEFDLEHGSRGSRYDRTGALLRELTGAEDAVVVNNCAAAVLLVVDTFARGKETIVSRGELVEIGGGFRVPDVLRRAGTTLVECGSTNRTRVEDYKNALTPQTGLLLRTHTSNFRISGFTEDADPKELAALAHRAGVPLAEDLGSGAFVDLREYGLPHERTVQEAIADGIGIVAFSGDKVLGGPQAGIVAGKRALIARMKNNPLLRALRVGKLTIAALGATLQLYRDRESRKEIPFFAMLETTLDELRARAELYAKALPVEIVESEAYAGGGTLPEAALKSIAVSIAPGDAAAFTAKLRRLPLPIIARTSEGRVLLDLRTIPPHHDGYVMTHLFAVLDT
ncbi:MAG TPA: L-seryl-tRNA(Sec) selenium transferase [Candidatus Baltobacteraceae bacterium]|nr:L-seryl-tRNA(Sec) selenium transferase [Candidatus Baltobacteraceae bacterium]